MRARVTLGVGLPYQIDRVTLAVGLSFCLHKPCKRVTLSSGSSCPIAFGENQAKMASQGNIY